MAHVAHGNGQQLNHIAITYTSVMVYIHLVEGFGLRVRI
jgi:hypothetical protein